ncbi:MAG: hypothetical protein HDR28_08870 [Lachnospiraceae bacterium]|nr:hypothetical protein [Lachnospiraceae bacterium]
MFKVIIMHLYNSCSQIEQQVRTLSGVVEELESVILTVSALPGTEELVGRLNGDLRDLREEELLLRQMLQVLNKILLNYVNCEDRLINEFEQNIYFFQPKELGVFQIQKVSDLIK